MEGQFRDFYGPAGGRRLTTPEVSSSLPPLFTVSRASIVESARAALRLDVAAALLAFQPALFRSQRRPGRPPRNRPHHGLAQQVEQAIDGVGAVAFLGAETLRMNHNHAVLGHTLAGEPVEPRRGISSQC